ncbi:MAG: leucyl aminopeptidase family protein [Mycoplasmataceae bacterium]|nr:leucyl aminopeptidase family protein [Mycoplasmataceae bacterium]
MLEINKTKKYSSTLIAIDENNKLNKTHKKNDATFILDKSIYWVYNYNTDSADFGYAFLTFASNQKESINIDINSFLLLITDENKKQAIVNAILSAAAFASDKYSLKTINKNKTVSHNLIVDVKKYGKYLNEAKILAEVESFAKTLITMPGNYLSADDLERIYKNKFSKLKNIKFSVLHKPELLRKKMGLITAVGQSSQKNNEPRIITVSYNTNPSKKKIALVGKGIMFDTGGLNLKPGEFMLNMHNDMAGAAIVLATIYALAKLNVKANIVGVAAISSNEIGPYAYRVNDVLTSYDGRTVEILNTDAEGRLALADGISYAKKDLQAKTIMTVATLTGAISVALGELYTGIWASDESQWKELQSAANNASELIWRMPLHHVYQDAIVKNTQVADIANMSPGRIASSNTAAEFLHFFANNVNFIHADIAATTEFKKQPIAALIKTMFYFIKDKH